MLSSYFGIVYLLIKDITGTQNSCNDYDITVVCSYLPWLVRLLRYRTLITARPGYHFWSVRRLFYTGNCLWQYL